MNNLIATIKGVLLLDEKTYQRLLATENSMKTGIFYLLVCFLIVAIPSFISGTIDNVTPFTAERAAIFQEEFLQRFEPFARFMPGGGEDFEIFMEQFKENFAMGTNIAVAIEALPQPLPRAVGGILRSFGGWLSSPFTHLAAWMGYAIWVLLFAKVSGGRGGVNRFLGLTALYAVPNLLGFLSFIPYLGWAISLVGVVWGWVVYVRGVEVSQEFTPSKAILVSILPLFAILALLLFFSFLLGIGVAGLVGSMQ
jgi:hypothetical protein